MSWTVEEKRLVINAAGSEEWVRIAIGSPIDKSMAADFTTKEVDALYFEIGSVQTPWTGADATDGVITIQASLDKVCWCSLSGMIRTVDVAAECGLFNLENKIGYRYFRVKFVANTITAGTMNFRYLLKTQR